MGAGDFETLYEQLLARGAYQGERQVPDARSARPSRSRWSCSGSSRAAASSSCCSLAMPAERKRAEDCADRERRAVPRVVRRKPGGDSAARRELPRDRRQSGSKRHARVFGRGTGRARPGDAGLSGRSARLLARCAKSCSRASCRATRTSAVSCITTAAWSGPGCMRARWPAAKDCVTTSWCSRTSPIARSSRSSCRSHCATSRRCSKRCRWAWRRPCRARSCWPTASSPTCSDTAMARSSACRCGT